MQELNDYSQKKDSPTQIWNLIHHQFDINEIQMSHFSES